MVLTVIRLTWRATAFGWVSNLQKKFGCLSAGRMVLKDTVEALRNGLCLTEWLAKIFSSFRLRHAFYPRD